MNTERKETPTINYFRFLMPKNSNEAAVETIRLTANDVVHIHQI